MRFVVLNFTLLRARCADLLLATRTVYMGNACLNTLSTLIWNQIIITSCAQKNAMNALPKDVELRRIKCAFALALTLDFSY